MNRTSHLLLAVAMGLACSNRDPPPEEPDRVGLCARHCEQLFSSCNPDPPANWEGPSSEDDCNSNCVEDAAWAGECRFKHAEFVTCTTELDCDEFSSHQSDNLHSPCASAASEWSSCIP